MISDLPHVPPPIPSATATALRAFRQALRLTQAAFARASTMNSGTLADESQSFAWSPRPR